MTSDFPCLADVVATSAKVVMTVDSPVIPSVSIVASPGTSVGIGGTLTLRASVTNGGTNPTYQWYMNSDPVAGATSATFTHQYYDSTFEDSVSVVVTSSGVCPMTTDSWVYILTSDVGVANVAATIGELSVLPNPSKGTFTIRGSLGTTADAELTIEITDLLGQEIYQNKVITQGGKVNERVTLGSDIANGMYILNLRTDTDTRVYHVVVEQ